MDLMQFLYNHLGEGAEPVQLTWAPYGRHLPIFPTLYAKPSEDALERVVERLVDRADKALMQGLATQEQYDAWTVALDRWASAYR